MCGSLAVVALICGLPAGAQISQGCLGINYVGADSGNPFVAELVMTSTMATPAGAPKITVMTEAVARDSQGRIRFEKHGIAQPPDDRKTVELVTPDGKPFTVTREEYGTLIEIFDCNRGTSVRIQPGMRIATVKQAKQVAPTNPVKHAYSTPYMPRPGPKIPPNMTIEPLGNREIHGIPALGVKTTTLGKEEDGDWSGKPIRETELWLSDELAAHLVRIDKDLRAGSEGKWELMAIKREESDPVWFEIPKDYEVNPARLPISKNQRVIRPSKQ
jgi:hypothetical protein